MICRRSAYWCVCKTAKISGIADGGVDAQLAKPPSMLLTERGEHLLGYSDIAGKGVQRKSKEQYDNTFHLGTQQIQAVGDTGESGNDEITPQRPPCRYDPGWS